MQFHQQFSANHNGRDFVLGDLHGMVDLLHQELEQAEFDPERDRCFSVGDLIDRGPDSVRAAELVEQNWFHAVRGNHEDLLIRSVDGGDRKLLNLWRQNGGSWGIRWWRPNVAARACAELCRSLPYVVSLQHRSGWRIGICHAQCPVGDWADIDTVAAEDDRCQELLWGRNRISADNPQPVQGIDLTVHGHTVIGKPLLSRNALFIDTGAYRSNHLTLLCLDDWIADNQ